MSLSSSFELLSFQHKVNDALKSVERTLELERKPRLAADVDHTYGAKYGLVNLTSNAAIIAYMNCFDKLGLDATVLKSIDKTKPVTLRYDTSTAWRFQKEVIVDVPVNRSYEEREVTTGCSDASKNTTKTRVMKAVHHINEYHWEVEVNWSISLYSGTSVEEKKVIKSRAYKTSLITQSKEGMGSTNLYPIELSLTWLLQQIDTAELNSQFKVDTEDVETKTPRRNPAVEKSLDFAVQLRQWCERIEGSFFGHLQQTLRRHNPAVSKPQNLTMDQMSGIKQQYSIFNPILPLMEETPARNNDNDRVETKSIIVLGSNDDSDEHKALLSSEDISRLLNEHVRILEGAVNGVEESWPSDGTDGILSSAEVTLSLICNTLKDLSTRYDESMSYIESMIENQLIAAIGKRLTPNDLDKFVKFHSAKLLRPMPQPFSHAIRRPEHYPVGLLSIESHDGEKECIHCHSREVVATSNLKIPLNAATVLELTGRQYLHGYMNHRFGTSDKSHQLVARARQFSAFILVVGNMTDGSTLDPKDAIIVQNKDELLIPLLLDELPTAKEFKDAVKSLSPEQQRFARAYRKMQLASSVFGVCVIQIKPQLEALLGLPADALDKEMKLTQDLMELFIEYQVPSDLLSYSAFSENAAVGDKISNVRANVKGVLGVVNAEKEEQLKAEEAKTVMAMEKELQRMQATTFSSAFDRGSRRRKMAMDPPDPIAVDVFGGDEFGDDLCCAVEPDSSVWNAMMERDGRGDKEKKKTKVADVGEEMKAYYDLKIKCWIFPGDDPAEAAKPLAPPPIIPKRTDAAPSTPSTTPAASFAMMDDGDGMACSTKREASEIQRQLPTQEEENRAKTGESGGELKQSPGEGVDYTLIPHILDAAVEKSGDGSALRSTTVRTGDVWTRNRQEHLLTQLKRQSLDAEEVKKEKNKAFDLLDALSRGGSLPIAYSELHVVVAVTHCFDKDVMSTVVCDNVDPIEKLERSTLLLASAVHRVPARGLIADARELQRLEGSLPLLLQPPGNE